MENLLTAKEVQAHIPWISLSTLYRRARAGTFVRPVSFGGKRLWPADEVEAWIAERFATRDARAAERQEAAA